ncbi:LCP family protein [cyanobacterium endosymbiont of Epithemia turgida]|uniref:LCP family protein n=1 Tax=cyanobacterium endosymbiont of Epithemia turgida TaxID=718217 RepID=UPI0004D13EFE|nr:LCP family protein [cyanobacterium endosymbiont of Epithemia turgida]BAP17687.1 cell envelope-like transcriptional attenuator [cyanobacterium endosymbiont of Epithemia turgida isolate EtSB Lake Yunoko]
MTDSFERMSTITGLQQTPVPRKFPKSGKYIYKSRNTSPTKIHAKTLRSKGLIPFYRGLLWGITFSCTAALSATVGATITLFSPLSEKLIPFIEQIQLPWEQKILNPETGTSSAIIPQPQQKEEGLILQYRLSRPVNILVLGIDRVPDAPPGSLDAFGGRSDTILILRFDPSDYSVKMLSIPRDSRVNIPGIGYTKVNDANIYRGPALTARVLSKTLNDVPIDRYVRVTTDIFIKLVNLVGGVEVFVSHPMKYEDKTQNLKIDLKVGQQILSGEQAEHFARFRKDSYGDIGRVQRQQILLKALLKQLYAPTILPHILKAISLLEQSIDTNLTWEEMLTLANFGRQVERKNLQMVMLPGRFSQENEFDSRSYWVLSSGGIDQIMQEYFDVTSEWKPLRHRSSNRVRIALQNATDDPRLGKRMVEYLAGHDFHNVYVIKDSPRLLGETEIVVQKGDLRAAQQLQTLLELGRVEASSTGDLDSQITLRIGLDAKKLVLGDSFIETSE